MQFLESAQVVNKMKEKLMKRLTELGPMLPTNSLDELIDGLGGPSKVSEVIKRSFFTVWVLLSFDH